MSGSKDFSVMNHTPTHDCIIVGLWFLRRRREGVGENEWLLIAVIVVYIVMKSSYVQDNARQDTP